MIQVGHGAYRAPNHLAFHQTRMAAANDLVGRGISRKEAWAVLARVMSKPYGYEITSVTQWSSGIEVWNNPDRV